MIMESRPQCWGLAVAIFVLAEAVLMFFVDRPLSEYLRGVDTRDYGLIDIFRAYTDFGKGFWYLWPSGVGFLICFGLSRSMSLPPIKRHALLDAAKKFGFFFACVAISGLTTDCLKRIFGRARPVMLVKENFYGFHPFNFHYAYNSLPSGHATTAFAVACALAVLWPRWRPGFVLFALILSASRVMVNAHFLSDVAAGAAIAFVTVSILQEAFRRRGWLPAPNDG